MQAYGKLMATVAHVHLLASGSSLPSSKSRKPGTCPDFLIFLCVAELLKPRFFKVFRFKNF